LDPLSEAELDQLAERLERIKNDDALSFEGLDGFFCALIASPDRVAPSAYLPIILGGEQGSSEFFANLDEANATVGLILRYWNSILTDLEKESVHAPCTFDVEPGQVPGRAWARGFMRGVALAPEGWDELFENEEEGDLFAIALVAGEIDPEWPKEPVTKQLEDDVLMSLAVGFARSYRYFAEARSENAGAVFADTLEDEGLGEDYYPETYVRPEPKVGRNDACPCGSGKKFKRCCGSPHLDLMPETGQGGH
jgi:uncharacterized protein